MNPQFSYSASYRHAIAETTLLNAVKPRQNSGFCFLISQIVQPVLHRIAAVFGGVMPDLEHPL